MGIGRTNHHVPFDLSISNLEQDERRHTHETEAVGAPVREPHLAYDVGIGEPYDQAMFGRVVLVLVLSHKTLAGIIVRLPLYRDRYGSTHQYSEHERCTANS